MDEKKKQFTLLEWLGYREFPLYEKARWLGHTLGFAIVAVAILMLVLAAYVLFQFTMAVTGPLEANGEAIRNIGFVVAALVGLPFIVWRAVVAQQQVNVAEQSHITDRISKAVEQLGAEKTVKRLLKDADGNPVFDIDGITPKTVETTEPNIEVRLGGIYALDGSPKIRCRITSRSWKSCVLMSVKTPRPVGRRSPIFLRLSVLTIWTVNN